MTVPPPVCLGRRSVLPGRWTGRRERLAVARRGDPDPVPYALLVLCPLPRRRAAGLSVASEGRGAFGAMRESRRGGPPKGRPAV